MFTLTKLPSIVAVLALASSTAGLAFGYSSFAAFQIFLTVEWTAVFASGVNIGGIIGSIISSVLLHAYGRRLTLISSCLPGIAGWLGLRLSADAVYELYSPTVFFILGRILTGVSAGMVIPAATAYLVEIAPTQKVSIYGSFAQIGIVSGILLAYLLGSFLPWESVAVVNALISVLTLFGTLSIPESPRWLLKAGLHQQANTVQNMLHGGDALSFNAEVKTMEAGGTVSEAQKNLGIRQILLPWTMIPSGQRSRLFIAILIMMFQQLTGVSAVLYFAESVCLFGGLPLPSACAVVIGVTQVVFTCLALRLFGRYPRKQLLMWSALIMCAGHLSHGAFIMFSKPYSVINLIGKLCVILFLFGYSIGWGPLAMVAVADLFPTSTRGFACSIAVNVMWIVGFIVTLLFEPLNVVLGPAVLFWFYSLCCLFAYHFIHRYLPDSAVPNQL